MGCLHECCCEDGRADVGGNRRHFGPTPPVREAPIHVRTDSGKKKAWHQKLQCLKKRKRHAADVYYVKGSTIPVESLELDCHDSRLYYPSHRDKTATNSGNPSLLFLMYWQIIPPLSRLAVLQRAVHCRHHSLLPVIREAPGPVGGGDSSQRGGRRIPQSRQSRGRSSGDDEEERPRSQPQTKPPSARNSPVTSRRGPSTSVAGPSHSRSTSLCRRTPSPS